MFTNLLNRATRTLFYSFQKYNEGGSVIPRGRVSGDVKKLADETIIKYEGLMADQAFHLVMNLLEEYFRQINKAISTAMKDATVHFDKSKFDQAMIDAMHMVKTATILSHPIAPESTRTVMEFMNLDDRMFSWDNIFDSIDAITTAGHEFKTLEPRFDFYKKPEWQYK
jgi:methionyl-tRNA synthetase